MGVSQLPGAGSQFMVGALKDFDDKTRTSGNLSLNSTTWANVDTNLDIVLDAIAGDVIEVSLNAITNNEGVNLALDVATIVGGSPVNYFSGGGGVSDTGLAGWRAVVNTYYAIGGSATRTLLAGDISGGTVTLRLRYRTDTAAVRSVNATTALPFKWSAKNLGQVNLSTPLIPGERDVPTTISVVSAGLTTATTAYSAGDQMGTQMTFANAVASSGAHGTIISATLLDKAKVTGGVDLYLFDRSITPAADNAAFAFSDSDMDFCQGVIEFRAPKNGANNSLSLPVNMPILFKSNATSLFGAMVTMTGHTFFGAVTDLVVTLQIVQD